MMKRLILCMWILALLIPVAVGLAQPGIDDVEGLIDAAIGQLGQQVGLALGRADLSRWRWEETYFTDSALNCPLPDESYTVAYTRGYAVLLDYQAKRYEFHLTPDGSAVHFCGEEAFSLPTPTPSPTPDEPESAAESTPIGPLSDPHAAFDLALVYLNDQTHLGLTPSHLTTWSWRVALWDDESLACPQPNRTYTRYPHPISGFSFTLLYGRTEYELHMTWDGSRIMPCHAAQLVPYVDRGRDPLSQVPPTPTATPALAG